MGTRVAGRQWVAKRQPYKLVTGGGGPVVPALYQRMATGTLQNGRGLSASAFTIRLANPSAAGNCLVLIADYNSGATITSITDDKLNTWPAAAATADNTGNMKTSIFVLPNATAGTRVITVNYGAAIATGHYIVLEFYNVLSAAAVGATATSITGTAPNIVTGAISPAANNLVLMYAMQNANIFGGGVGTTSVTSWTAGSGWTMEGSDYASGNSGGPVDTLPWGLQLRTAPGGSITPSITTTGTNTYNAIALELKASASASGTQPPAGVFVKRVQFYTCTNVNQSPWIVPFVNEGNTIAFTEIAGISQAAPTDNASGVWAMPIVGTVNGNVALAYAKGAAASQTRAISLNTAGRATNPNTTVCMYDIQGASSSAPLGATGTGVLTSETGNFTNQPLITPTVANGVVICGCAIGIGPLTGLNNPPGANFFCVTYPGETDFDSFNNADGYGLVYYGASLAQQNWSWGFGGTAQSAYSSAAEFHP